MKKLTFLAAAAAIACLWSCEDPLNDVVAEVSVSPASVTFEADGGTLKVAVTANVDFDITGAASWLKVEKSDKELSLTAEANTVNEARSCELTLTAGDASAKVTVNQKAGSPYPGYTVATAAELEYMGTVLYQFLKPSEEDYGGAALLVLTDEEDNGVALWIYTDLFASEEEIELTTGTYVKGDDDFSKMTLCAKKLTYMRGFLASDDEDDPYYMGSYYGIAATKELGALVDGTIEITKDNSGNYTIKADMTDEAGNEHKYVYVGEVTIDAEGAGYPSATDRIDVANTIFAAVCYYKGDVYENGTTQFALQLLSGDPDNYAITNFDFYTDAVDFSEDFDLSGEYYSEEEESTHAAGTVDLGVLTVYETPYGTFQFPSGAFVMYSYDDYLIADGFASLMLQKQDDGKYTMMGALMSSDNNMVMIMGSDYSGIHDLEIPIIDGRDDEED